VFSRIAYQGVSQNGSTTNVSVWSRTTKGLAHVEDGSQATPSRKGLDHYFVYILSNDIDQRVDQHLLAATYVVDNDSRCSRTWWELPIAHIVHGAHACYRSMHQGHPTKKRQNEHSSFSSSSSLFVSLICVACPETRIMLTLEIISIRASINTYNKRIECPQIEHLRPTNTSPQAERC